MLLVVALSSKARMASRGKHAPRVTTQTPSVGAPSLQTWTLCLEHGDLQHLCAVPWLSAVYVHARHEPARQRTGRGTHTPRANPTCPGFIAPMLNRLSFLAHRVQDAASLLHTQTNGHNTNTCRRDKRCPPRDKATRNSRHPCNTPTADKQQTSFSQQYLLGNCDHR